MPNFRRLPVLANLRIATPCAARWQDMVGDERVRFCPSCLRDVFNLSAMTHYDAEELVRKVLSRLEPQDRLILQFQFE